MRSFILTAFAIFAFAAPAYPITVEEAVQQALKHNPDLQALRLEEEVALGRLEKARQFFIHNPTLEGNISQKDKPQEDGGGAFTNYGFRLSQEFEVAGQRSSRAVMAENELAGVKASIRDKERILTFDVKNTFAGVLALKKKGGLAREIIELKQELLGYTRIKFQAGDVSALDVNLAEVELSKAGRDLLQNEREYRESLLTLQGYLGGQANMPVILEGDLPVDAPVPPDRKFLTELAFSRRPDALFSSHEMEKTRAGLQLAQKETIPNVTLSGFYDRDELRNAGGIAISIPIPLFDRKQAERKDALAKAGSAKIKSDGLRKTIELEVEQALSDMISAAGELTLFKNEIILKAAENLSLLNLAFKEGKVGFFEVRVAQKDMIDAQFAYLDARMRTQLAQNALEKAVGGTLK